MLADTYGIGGRVVFKYLNAYGCLRWVWVGGLELSKRLRMLTVGVGGVFRKIRRLRNTWMAR